MKTKDYGDLVSNLMIACSLAAGNSPKATAHTKEGQDDG